MSRNISRSDTALREKGLPARALGSSAGMASGGLLPMRTATRSRIAFDMGLVTEPTGPDAHHRLSLVRADGCLDGSVVVCASLDAIDRTVANVAKFDQLEVGERIVEGREHGCGRRGERLGTAAGHVGK